MSLQAKNLQIKTAKNNLHVYKRVVLKDGKVYSHASGCEYVNGVAAPEIELLAVNNPNDQTLRFINAGYYSSVSVKELPEIPGTVTREFYIPKGAQYSLAGGACVSSSIVLV